MIKLSFMKIMPENAERLSETLDKKDLEELRKMIDEHKGVVFALDSGSKLSAVSAMVFDAGDEDLTTALRKLWLKAVYIGEDAEKGHDGIMLEYTVNQAANMGYDLLTVKVSTKDISMLKFYAYHGFDKIVRVDEKEKMLIIQRDIKAKMKCCGLG